MSSGINYLSPRQVGLVRREDSKFGEALAEFVTALGLGLSEVVLQEPLPGSLPSAVDDAIMSSGAVVLALEGNVLHEDLGAAGSLRTAQSSYSLLATYGYLSRVVESDKIIVAKQRGDPVAWPEEFGTVIALANDESSSNDLVRELKQAGLVIEAVRANPGARTFEFPAEWWRRDLQGSQKGSELPSFTEFLVDSVFNRSITQTQLNDEAREIIKGRKPLELKYHYVGWRAAKAWTSLTKDRKYGHTEHVTHIVNSLPAIIESMDLDAPCNYISLGPGGGETDAELLPVLGTHLPVQSIFLVDVSIELLQIAADVIIRNVLEPAVLQPSPRVRAMLADFEGSLKNLAPVINTDGVTNLFTLLGFTIGNGAEQQLLKSVSEGTRSGDYVLLDVRLHPHGVLPKDFCLTDDQSELLVSPYDSEALKQFGFAPVEEAADYVVRAGDESIDIKLNPEWHHKFGSPVPNSINVYVECHGLYRHEPFRKRLKIGKGSEDDPITLITLTFYDLQSLVDYIEGSGDFRVPWAKQLNGSGVLLLERTRA
jgi:Histidine-specific methyltransferase, SAM-dependent